MNEPDTLTPLARALDATEPPARVVDSLRWGWHRLGPNLYERDAQPGGMSDLPRPGPVDLATLTAIRGPLRPVVAPAPGELDTLVSVMLNARRKALLSVLAACRTLVAEEFERLGGQWGGAGHLLSSGLGGSREAALLRSLAAYGGAGLDAPWRTHPLTVKTAHRIVRRWCDDPAGAVEVAGNLSHVCGRVIDEATHPGEGLALIADQHMMSRHHLNDHWVGTMSAFALATSSKYGPYTE